MVEAWHPDGQVVPPWVVGIDPSLTGTGIAFPDGTTQKIGRAGITNMGWDEKEDAIDLLASSIINAVVGPPLAPVVRRPDAAVMEALDVAARYGGIIERVMLWTAIKKGLRIRGIPVLVVASGQRLGYLTGKGAGGKGVVVENITRLLPDADIQGDDNRADALTFMLMGMDKLGHSLVTLPEKNRAWLERCHWTSQGMPPKVKTVRAKTALSAQ